eukprot:CAMPEP_0183378242 /NCGR_PEP_ID=MMETSP0164_2-20130417/124810_1 /TAXON_ID=221442 /ORGANISM="Coccolithus pelagicus ssp braarudi, Strain PLY182g" /LENGTH=418 /DNA_ID=CAMNT_0025555793 /DNA_START=152 /DNA_END=1409 /DNA_ORIENTATION=-
MVQLRLSLLLMLAALLHAALPSFSTPAVCGNKTETGCEHVCQCQLECCQSVCDECCPSSPPPPPLSPSLLSPLPSQPPSRIPAEGILVLKGSADSTSGDGILECFWPGNHDFVTTAAGAQMSIIATQCCIEGAVDQEQCKRKLNGACIAGDSLALQGKIKPFTYGQAEESATGLAFNCASNRVRSEAATTTGTLCTRLCRQCCIEGAVDQEQCKRKLNGACIAGDSLALQGKIKPFTYGQAEDKCHGLGLQLCQQSCAFRGCNYNRHPVYTSLPCPDRFSPSPPSLPLTSRIPAKGILVLKGSAESTTDGDILECFWPGKHDLVTTAAGAHMSIIATQCCIEGADGQEKCRRKMKGACIAGDSLARQGEIVPFTYGQAEEKCHELGLQLCKQSCAFTGCNYNRHPVYTSLPCPSFITR